MYVLCWGEHRSLLLAYQSHLSSMIYLCTHPSVYLSRCTWWPDNNAINTCMLCFSLQQYGSKPGNQKKNRGDCFQPETGANPCNFQQAQSGQGAWKGVLKMTKCLLKDLLGKGRPQTTCPNTNKRTLSPFFFTQLSSPAKYNKPCNDSLPTLCWSNWKLGADKPDKLVYMYIHNTRILWSTEALGDISRKAQDITSWWPKWFTLSVTAFTLPYVVLTRSWWLWLLQFWKVMRTVPKLALSRIPLSLGLL